MRKKKAAEPVAVPVTTSASKHSRTPDAMWSGRPVFRCRLCHYERVDNLQAVLDHEGLHPPKPKTSKRAAPKAARKEAE